MAAYTRITYNERQRIRQMLQEGLSVSEIAQQLRRSKSTISTEIRRKNMNIETYAPSQAQADANWKRKLIRRRKKIVGALESAIQLLMLEKRWSPEQISNVLKKKYPQQTDLHVSPEAIYQHVYRSSNRAVYCAALRSKRKKRRSHKSGGIKRGGIRNRVSIHSRPTEVESREVPGHWEGDLIVGKGHKSAIGTLVERTTRYTIIVPLKAKDSESVVNAFLSEMNKLPSYLKKSLTYDQGSEMAQHERFTLCSGIPVYFADPGSPWQRGSNENTNGLVRESFPKGTDFREIADSELKHVEELLNTRPRKVLDYVSPKQSMANLGVTDLPKEEKTAGKEVSLVRLARSIKQKLSAMYEKCRKLFTKYRGPKL
jgi:IS30 family transposase